ncbi:MAG: chloride channel protein [Mariprofundaceae bacterium]
MQARQQLSAAKRWLMQQEMLYLSLLAILIGVLSGYAALALRFGIEWVAMLWTGEIAWDRALDTIPWYIFLLAPTTAGIIVGLINNHLMNSTEMRGVAGVLADLVERGGRINRKQLVTETFGSAVSIGSGVSLGREGPTVALGAVIASEVGHRLGLNEHQVRTLIGCGVAAGIAASFNTPIAGVLFALEVILADYAVATFSPIVISSVIATVISRAEVGNFPAFLIPEYHLVSTWEIAIYVLVGLACGLIAAALIRLMGGVRTILVRFVPDRRIRPILAGFCIGLLGLAIPQVMSIGYGTVGHMLLETINPELFGIAFPLGVFLAIVLVGKLLATAISFAAGFPGGLLGPAIFLGAVVGALFGSVVHDFAPAFTESYGAYALVACGALTAAALQAPITIMLMVFELSADYHIMLPLMAACIVATLVKRVFGRESVFTEALAERGIETSWGLEQSWMRAVKVTRIRWRPIPSVRENTPLVALKQIYVDTGKGCVQVVDDNDLMIGIITFTDLQPWLLDASMDHVVVAAEVANRNVHTIAEDDSLLDAIATFDREVYEQLIVTAADNSRRVLGVLSRQAVFSTYHKLIVKHGDHGSN